MLEVLVIIGLVAVLILLVMAWYHYATTGSALNFWVAYNLMDCAGNVLLAIVALIANMFNSDS